MDGLRDDPRDDPMPYGVDTIRLRISFPTMPAPQGYDDQMWRMRPLRGWTGGQVAAEQPAGVEQGESNVDGGVATPVASAAQQGSAGSSLRATLDRVIAAMSTEPPAVEAQGGEGGLTAQRLGDAPPAVAQAGTPPQPGPGVEEHSRFWWWLHDHGLAQTKHEKADLLRKAMGPGSGRLVVDGNGVPVNVEQLSDDEVIALGKKLMDRPFELPFIGPGAPVNETPKPSGEDVSGSDATQRRNQLATVNGKITSKGESEADTILQTEREGSLQGVPRRPDLKASEPDHDFILEDNGGKIVGYAEIKTPVNPSLRPITVQANDVARSILRYPKTENLQVIVDLKNLDATSQAQFLDALEAGGVSRNSVTLLNAIK